MLNFHNLIAEARRPKNLHHRVSNSIRNYHVKGFDYINLWREPNFTVKIYFFDEVSMAQHSEVVNPHEHRYDFVTHVLAGEMENLVYRENAWGWGLSAGVFNKFRFKSPLAHANNPGFTWVEEAELEIEPFDYAAGDSYFSKASDIHTIAVEGSTVLCLVQFSDYHDLEEGTAFFTQDKEPPKLSGLYDEMSVDWYLYRLRQLENLL